MSDLEPVTERVLVLPDEDGFDSWKAETSREIGMRHRFLPQWCKDLWNEGNDRGTPLVPAKKFMAQPIYHYGEAYCMAVVAGVTQPQRWDVVVGDELTRSAPPAWLLEGAGFEALYECFHLLDGMQPKSTGPYAYGEEIMRLAIEECDARSGASALRAVQDHLKVSGCKLTQPDLLLLPREGGRLVAIEVKRLGHDRISEAQFNGFEVLRRCGIRCEVWWIAKTQSPRAPSQNSRGAQFQVRSEATQVAVPTLRVRTGIDWGLVRAKSLETSGVQKATAARKVPRPLTC